MENIEELLPIENEIVKALGEKENIIELDYSITRLCIKLKNNKLINNEKLRELGAAEVYIIEDNIEIVFGTKSGKLKNKIDKIIKL